MNKSKELAKNTAIITIGRISTQFLSFLLLPLYTAKLSTEEYGTVDLVNTYAQLILPIVLLQIDQALFRFMVLNRNSKENSKSCITSTSAFFVFQLLIFSTIFFIFTQFIYNKYSIYLYLHVVVYGISNILFQASRGFGDNYTYAISSFLCGGITIVCNVIFITYFKMSAEGLLISSIVGNLIASLFVIIKKKIIEYVSIKSFDKTLLIKMIKYAWPLVPNALIWWVVNASDRSIVLAFLGTSANGILAISHKFPSLLMTVYNIFHISWTESAALHLSENDKDSFFSNVFDTILRLFSAACMLLIAVMPFVFNIFINQSYLDSYLQIPIYTLASLFNIIVGLYSVVYISNMKTSEIAKTSIMAGIINVAIHFLLIKYIGLFAASISSAIAFGTMAVYRYIDVKKYIKQKISYRLLLVVLMSLIVGFYAYYSNYRIIQLFNLFYAGITSILLNKNSIVRIKALINVKIGGNRK